MAFCQIHLQKSAKNVRFADEMIRLLYSRAAALSTKIPSKRRACEKNNYKKRGFILYKRLDIVYNNSILHNGGYYEFRYHI